jgi:hypothetical protein
MAKRKPNPYDLQWPEVPPEIWIPFLVGLTGDWRYDKKSIVNLAAMFQIDPEVIKNRVLQEAHEQQIMTFDGNKTVH